MKVNREKQKLRSEISLIGVFVCFTLSLFRRTNTLPAQGKSGCYIGSPASRVLGEAPLTRKHFVIQNAYLAIRMIPMIPGI